VRYFMKLLGLQAIALMAVCCGALAQGAPQDTAFEVVSIKPHTPQRLGSVDVTFRRYPGRLTYMGATLKEILTKAYGVLSIQINGPAWIDEDQYDIDAKIPTGVGPDQVPAMLQHMLAERFKIVTHRESRDQPVYALLVAKGGPKLKKSSEQFAGNSAVPADDASEGYSSGRVWNGPGAAPAPALARGVDAPIGRMQAHHVTLAIFAKQLSSRVDQVVVDMTGLPGEYDFDFDKGGDVASALGTYGLKLEPRKAAVDVLVVDRSERRPTEN
jgi:uncharacterized protein (TIGR03435 family)